MSEDKGKAQFKKLIDRGLTFQVLQECFKSSNQRKKPFPHTEISFATEEITTTELTNGEGKIGIILWVARKDFDEVANE